MLCILLFSFAIKNKIKNSGYRTQLSGNDVTRDVASALRFSMAPLLVPLKCGFHIQRRKLSLLLQQSRSVHAWICHDHRVANQRKQRSTYQVHSPLSHTRAVLLKLYKHPGAHKSNLTLYSNATYSRSSDCTQLLCCLRGVVTSCCCCC